MSWTGEDLSNLGPIDLLYRGAETVLNATQSAFPSSILPRRAVADFFAIVRWDEPFIQALLLAQAVFLSAVFLSRRRYVAQGVLFFYAAAVVFSARWINDAGRNRWPMFATQDYFDRQGLFMLIFVCVPLIFGANVIVVRRISLRLPYLAPALSLLRLEFSVPESDMGDLFIVASHLR